MIKILKFFPVLIASLFLSCGNSDKELEVLRSEIEILKKGIEECQFGADKLLAKANIYFEQKEYEKSKIELNTLVTKHPGSPEVKSAESLLEKINLEIENLKELKKEEEREKIKKEKQRLANATSKMRKKTDDMNGITWYHDKNSPRYTNQNGFFAYIGTNNSSTPWLRLGIQYAADDWLFIEKYIIKVDDKTYNIIEEKYGEIETDNGSGGIWEWLDRSVDQDEFDIIKAVANGDNVKIRYVGRQYYKDRTISNSQKQALKNVINAYESLGGTLK